MPLGKHTCTQSARSLSLLVATIHICRHHRPVWKLHSLKLSLGAVCALDCTVYVIIQRFSRLGSRIDCEVSSIPTEVQQKFFSCRRFDYSVVVFFKAWQYSTEHGFNTETRD